MGWFSSFLMLIGRLLLATLFLVSVHGKVYGYENYVGYMASKSLPAVPLLLGLAIVIEFVGGLSLILGYKLKAAALILALFLIPVTYFMHDFWNIQDPAVSKLEFFSFFANVGLIGGLLYVVANGAGYFGFDSYNREKNSKKEVVVGEIREIK